MPAPAAGPSPQAVVAQLGDPGGERGLGVVGDDAQEAEEVRDDEHPDAVFAH